MKDLKKDVVDDNSHVRYSMYKVGEFDGLLSGLIPLL